MPEATFKKISKNFPEIFLRTKFSGKFFRRKWRIFHGKFCGKFHGKCTGNPFQISLKNSVEISAETGFSAEKNVQEIDPRGIFRRIFHEKCELISPIFFTFFPTESAESYCRNFPISYKKMFDFCIFLPTLRPYFLPEFGPNNGEK
jgi:hypothetical protein